MALSSHKKLTVKIPCISSNQTVTVFHAANKILFMVLKKIRGQQALLYNLTFFEGIHLLKFPKIKNYRKNKHRIKLINFQWGTE